MHRTSLSIAAALALAMIRRNRAWSHVRTAFGEAGWVPTSSLCTP